ncbi:MAG TPA: DUF5615 family PIN-like protein [Dehalococcoidia bacterium]|nr:DUF5615 family PIN-like protein [Dehalococcoidia bacterium]
MTDPRVMVGKPVVRGTRIPVEAVLAHLADNPDLDDLFQAYPRLTKEDVKAYLAFASERVRGTPVRGPVRFLLDESVDARLAYTLRTHSHEATVVGVDHPNSITDEDVLAIARREGRILITNDRDFGELVFKQGRLHACTQEYPTSVSPPGSFDKWSRAT